MWVIFSAAVATSQKIFCLMPARKMQIGKDAIISILSISLHPSQHIRRAIPNAEKGHLLDNLTVLRQEHQRISHKQQLAVIVMHSEFVAQDGMPIELYMACKFIV
jgi:hypothetical protein